MDAEQEAAASKIAAAKKGKQARAEAQEKKKAASTVAAAQRGRAARKEKKDQEKAATAIQSRKRGQKARRMLPSDGQRYYTPAEVASHNSAEDLWVSFFGWVVDLTPLVKENPGHLVQPLINSAGTDISHWFDPVTKNVRTYIDSKTELEVPFTPMGHFLHCPPAEPTSNLTSDVGTVWWRDASLRKGHLTQRTRMIQLENMLTNQKIKLEVCEEETLQEIQNRYMKFNSHSGSYTWKRTDSETVARLLDMTGTLDENGIKDDAMEFENLNIDAEFYIPTIQIYFSDDLTIA